MGQGKHPLGYGMPDTHRVGQMEYDSPYGGRRVHTFEVETDGEFERGVSVEVDGSMWLPPAQMLKLVGLLLRAVVMAMSEQRLIEGTDSTVPLRIKAGVPVTMVVEPLLPAEHAPRLPNIRVSGFTTGKVERMDAAPEVRGLTAAARVEVLVGTEFVWTRLGALAHPKTGRTITAKDVELPKRQR